MKVTIFSVMKRRKSKSPEKQSVCLCVSMCLCESVCLCTCVYMCMCVHVFLYVCLYSCLCLRVPVIGDLKVVSAIF